MRRADIESSLSTVSWRSEKSVQGAEQRVFQDILYPQPLNCVECFRRRVSGGGPPCRFLLI